MLLKKYPELKDKPYQSYVYEFPIENANFNTKNFLSFIK